MECLDRISELPEPIMHHILSFLVAKDVIRTAATSKKLNQVWTTLPYLDLGDDFFPLLPRDKYEWPGWPAFEGTEDEDENHEEGENGGQNSEEDDPNVVSNRDDLKVDEKRTEIIRKREELFTFVEQTLTRRRMHGVTIQKFRLGQTELDGEVIQYLDKWIHCVVHCNINELVLLLSSDEECYDLPGILLTATSLRALTLSGCRMPCGSITLSSLQKLHLTHVYLDENILLDIISTCRDLEDLLIAFCSGFKGRMHVPGRPQLRVFQVYLCTYEVVDEVVVEAQYLEKLTYNGGFCQAKINIITNFEGGLKCLHLCGANITNTWFCELISRLTRLEELYLSRLNLKAIEISSSSLKRLTLYRVFDYKVITFGEFTIDTPNLVYLNYYGSLSSVFRNNAAVKEVFLYIVYIRRPHTDEQMCKELMQFLHKFDYSEVVTLDCTYFEDLIFPTETRVELLAPLIHIKHLKLQGSLHTSQLDVLAELLECLLWIAPTLDNLSLESNRFEAGYPVDLFIKFTYEFAASQCDCSNFPWSCLKKRSSLLEFDIKCADAEVCRFLRNSLTQSALLLKVKDGHE